MSVEDEHGLAGKKHEAKETKKVEKTEDGKKKKQRVHKDTNTAIKKGMQAASHDSANCDSDYCDIC